MVMHKYFVIILKVIVASVLMLSVIFGIIIFGPLAFHLKPYKITSSSMSPVINKGDLIYIKEIDPLLLKPDDIITFYQYNSNVIITHRISRIDKDNRLIYTIGDMNPNEDPEPIQYEDVIGKYVFYKIPKL